MATHLLEQNVTSTTLAGVTNLPVLTANRVKVSQSDFSKGQNSSAHANEISQNEAALLENCIITKTGRVTQRKGITTLGTANSTTNKILGIFHYNVGGTLDTILRARATKIQRLNAGYTDWTDITGLTTLTTGLTTNFVQAIDKCFIMNGTDDTYSIDSAFTVTDEGNGNTSFPICTFAEWASNNRMFASGSQTVALRDYVYFSNPLDPQTWDRTLNLFKVRSGNGGKTTWLKMFKEFELIIYKNDSIFVLEMDGATPLTDWTVKPLSTVIGCPAGRTVCDIGNDHIYLANDGVRLLSRTTFDKLRIGIISEPIQDIIDAINTDAVQNSVGWFENGLYTLGVPVGTSIIPNRWMIWDSIAANRNGDPNSAWTTIPTDTWNMSCLTSYGFGDNVRTVVGGAGLATSLCYKVLNGTTDAGTTIIQKIVSRQQDFDEAFLDKIFDPFQMVAEGGSDGVYLAEINIDETGWLPIGQLSLAGSLQTPCVTPCVTGGSTQEIFEGRTKFAGRGNLAQYRFTNSTSGKTPTFNEYTTYGRPYQGRIS